MGDNRHDTILSDIHNAILQLDGMKEYLERAHKAVLNRGYINKDETPDIRDAVERLGEAFYKTGNVAEMERSFDEISEMVEIGLIGQDPAVVSIEWCEREKEFSNMTQYHLGYQKAIMDITRDRLLNN